MTEKKYPEEVQTARSYYNSRDAQNFYSRIWGGEDLHLGIYDSLDDDIYSASRRTIDEMVKCPGKIDKNTKIIDLGGGFGGSGRHLAKKYGCHVTVINLSEVENEYGRKLNKEQNLEDNVTIIDGSFEDIPFEDESFDIVWSQDAILHSADRAKVMKEAARVLKKGGDLVFTDPMQTNNCDEAVLEPIYERINLASLGTPGFYKQKATEYGLTFKDFMSMPHQLSNHYTKVLHDTEKNEADLDGFVSKEYISNMKKGLKHWIEGGKNGNLTWGIFHFKK